MRLSQPARAALADSGRNRLLFLRQAGRGGYRPSSPGRQWPARSSLSAATESICPPESELVPVPLGADPAEAVCVVINYLTAPCGKQTPLFPDLGEDNAWYRQTLAELLGLPAEGKIEPVVAERIPLAEAARAH
jgi:NADPH:quinone reductase-like Zn-dependent oxidoreductase